MSDEQSEEQREMEKRLFKVVNSKNGEVTLGEREGSMVKEDIAAILSGCYPATKQHDNAVNELNRLLEVELEKAQFVTRRMLTEPHTVFINILRETIAKPSDEEAIVLYPHLFVDGNKRVEAFEKKVSKALGGMAESVLLGDNGLIAQIMRTVTAYEELTEVDDNQGNILQKIKAADTMATGIRKMFDDYGKGDFKLPASSGCDLREANNEAINYLVLRRLDDKRESSNQESK